MKHFGIYRKLILIIGTATAVVSVGVFFFMEDILFRTLFISFAFVFLCGLLFLMDFLHNRYNDNLLEEITLLIEALVEQQERMVFSEAEDTLTARLQHQLLKLRNILKAQKIKEAGYSDVTVCVITDGADEKTVHFHTGIYAQENETVIIEIE